MSKYSFLKIIMMKYFYMIIRWDFTFKIYIWHSFQTHHTFTTDLIILYYFHSGPLLIVIFFNWKHTDCLLLYIAHAVDTVQLFLQANFYTSLELKQTKKKLLCQIIKRWVMFIQVEAI